MLCVKCQKKIPEKSFFCNHCGASQKAAERQRKHRGNGQGSVYKEGGAWVAEVTLGYVMDTSGKRKRIKKKKYGFSKKKDALAYIEILRQESKPKHAETVADLYSLYHSEAEKKLSRSKMQAYEIAWAKIEKILGFRKIDSLTVPELQQITDAVTSSYYTARDVKNLLSNIYKIAIRDDIADKNRASYIILPDLHEEKRGAHRQALRGRLLIKRLSPSSCANTGHAKKAICQRVNAA